MGPAPPVLCHPLGGDPRVEGVHQRQSRTQQVPFDLQYFIKITSNFHKYTLDPNRAFGFGVYLETNSSYSEV